MGYASAWISKHKKDTAFGNFPTQDIEYNYRFKLYDHVLDQLNLRQTPVDYLEFGVFEGVSIKWWAEQLQHENSQFHGFDTFSGLPHDFGPYKKGHFGGIEKPVIDDDRLNFHQGLFQQTLLPYLSTYESSNIKLIHMDADLYSSTLYVLTLLTPYLKPGDIILFDEFNVPHHEFKAFKEWSESFYVQYEVLGEVNNYFQVAIEITE